MSIASSAVAAEVSREVLDSAAPANTRAWPVRYIRRAAQIRFGGLGHLPISYLVLTCALPVMWWLSMLLSGGYDARFIGSGSDEFRRVLDAAVSLAAGAVVVSYAAGLNLSRSYVGVALPTAALLDLGARYRLRKRLHLLRSRGFCTRPGVAVGHAAEVADLVATLRRDSYHGLSVVAACLASPIDANQVADVPVAGLLDSVAATVSRFGADTVAVLACPELGSYRLRELAWELEKTGTDLCVAPTLLDVAGPRTTIRPVAGLPLIYLDHPELVVGKQLAKSVFDKALAIAALVVLAPLFVLVALRSEE